MIVYSYCFKRSIQSQVHPQKYIRLLKLTDGSTLRVFSLTPPPSASKLPFSVSLLNLDSANHPSWNPELRDKLLLDDRGQVAKFRAKFDLLTDSNSSSSDYSEFLQMDPSLLSENSTSSSIKVKSKPIIPVKGGGGKKKK